MTALVPRPNGTNPIAEPNLTMVQKFRSWVNSIHGCVEDTVAQVALLTPILSTGSPEGVVPAAAGQVYLDTAGASGSRRYTKMVDDVAGNTDEGWVLD